MKQLLTLWRTLAVALPLGMLALTAAPAAAADGIKSLIVVTQMKAENANDEALAGAEKQRDLAQQQKQLRRNQATYEQLTPPAYTPSESFLYDETQTLK